MLKTETKKQVVKEKVVTTKICDKCGLEATYDDVVEWQEFYHIRFTGGYGSVFGDESRIECDLCQKCLKGMIGDICREEVM